MQTILFIFFNLFEFLSSLAIVDFMIVGFMLVFILSPADPTIYESIAIAIVISLSHSIQMAGNCVYLCVLLFGFSLIWCPCRYFSMQNVLCVCFTCSLGSYIDTVRLTLI